MALTLNGYQERVSMAVQSFWHVRENEGVRSGKTLDAFVDLLAWVVRNNGLPEATILTGRKAQLPGFFRPTKSWDVLIMQGDTLIAAIELKSMADSFGKNVNNRNEEALGSGIDIKEAFEEGAFEGLTKLFTGYLILIEECPETLSSVSIQMKHFRTMPEFMSHPETRESVYLKNSKGEYPTIKGVSYLKRFDILCRRLMQKNLYTAASVITSPRSAIKNGQYGTITRETGIKAFLVLLASHVEAFATIQAD